MSEHYYTAFSTGDDLDATALNAELSTIDAQIKVNTENIDDVLAGTKAVDPALLFAEETVTPDTPAASHWKPYFRDDGMYIVDDAGVVTGPFTDASVIADYIQIIDSQAKGTAGGASSATTWHTRVLNTEVHDTATIASVAGNVVTLAAGTYEIRASAPCNQGGAHELIWYNDSDGALEVQGFNAYANTTDGYTRALLSGRFTIAAEKTFTLRHYITGAQAANGLGLALNINDPDAGALTETYAEVELWRVSA